MKSEKGFTLIEVLVTLGIVGILGASFLSSLTNSTRAVIQTDQMDTGRALAQSMMEYVKEQKYSGSGYANSTALTAQYPEFNVSIAISTPGSAGQRDALIQNVTITVTQNGKTITTLEGFKTKR
jgi:prepilin-type N-terminal cleavage/methylation domain-containing protein